MCEMVCIVVCVARLEWFWCELFTVVYRSFHVGAPCFLRWFCTKDCKGCCSSFLQFLISLHVVLKFKFMGCFRGDSKFYAVLTYLAILVLDGDHGCFSFTFYGVLRASILTLS